MTYRLTLNNIIETLINFNSKSNGYLFRFVTNIKQKEFSSIDPFNDVNECPVENTQEFFLNIEKCFSSKNAKCTKINNANTAYFFMGGNRRLVSDTSFQSRLITSKPRTMTDMDLLIYDLTNWKGVHEEGGWSFENYEGRKVPNGVCSIIDYIIQMNDHIISKYCSQESQKDLMNILRDYARNLCEVEKTVPEWTKDMSPANASTVIMDADLMKMLAGLLDRLTRLAEASRSNGMQSMYLAEGLTWLLVASLLRGRFSALQEELTITIRKTQKAVEEKGIIISEEIWSEKGKLRQDSDTELYKRLMDGFRYIKDKHPSIRMMTPNPSLFPKGLPGISITERKAVEGNSNPLSIKDMVEKSWNEHKHLLLIGEGGIGKTVTMLTLPEKDWVCRYKIPAIYIPLQKLDLHNGKLDVYMRARYGDDHNRIIELSNRVPKGHPELLLLLDGFNEIPDKYKSTVEKSISDWMERPGIQIITTSRMGFSIENSFIKYILQPLPFETVKSFLLSAGLEETNLPGETDQIWNVINVPLMLILYTQIEKVREIIGGSSNFSLLDWKKPDNVAHIIWDYLQLELSRCLDKKDDSHSEAQYSVAILAVAPYICCHMADKAKFHINHKEFLNLIKEALSFYGNNQTFLNRQILNVCLENDINSNKELFQEKMVSDYSGILIKNAVLFEKQKSFDEDGTLDFSYSLVHQNFRDVLAAFYICSCLPKTHDKKKKTQLLDYAEYYVRNFISEFLSDEEMLNIWDQHRKEDPEDGHITYCLMDIIGRQKNYDYRKLDFGNIDLINTNIHQLLSKRLDICPLPADREFLNGTKVSLNSFLPNGHSSKVTMVVFSPDGRMLASMTDRTVKVLNLKSFEQHTLIFVTNHLSNISFVSNTET